MAHSDLMRGNIDTVILKILFDGDRYGYDMVKLINAQSDREIKQPAMYACLKRLEKQGFISSYWDESESSGGRRKFYTLTERGKEVFVTYKNERERSKTLFDFIEDTNPVLAYDDFSDVEDDGYVVPKRKARKKSATQANKPKPVQTDIAPVMNDGANDNTPDRDINTAVNADEPIAPQEETIAQSQYDDLAQSEGNDCVVLDSSFGKESDSAFTENQYDYIEQSESNSNIEDNHGGDVWAAESESFFDARKNEYLNNTNNEAVETTTKYSVQSATPATDTATPPTTPAAPPVPYDSNSLPSETESLARREYKDILSELVGKCANTSSAQQTQQKETNLTSSALLNTEEESAATAAPDIRIKQFDDVIQAVSEMGNEVNVRSHNDSAKQYAHKYYYYSNRLLLTHYMIMCGAMLSIGFIMFMTFYLGLNMRMRYDYALYIVCGLIPIMMFIGAVCIYASNPDKKHRVNINFVSSIRVRLIIMAQVAVIIYCINLIMGMPAGFSAAYIPSLVLPACYALFIPISGVIFMQLLKSMRYAVE